MSHNDDTELILLTLNYVSHEMEVLDELSQQVSQDKPEERLAVSQIQIRLDDEN